MHIILTHTNADFDALASMLGAYKLTPSAVPILPQALNSNVEEFLTLYRGGLPFITRQDIPPRQKISQITLTDTQTFDAVKGIQPHTLLHIIEHHTIWREAAAHETIDYHPLGAITTHLVEQIQAQHIPITTLEATLLALGIYEDTGMLTYGGTTARDVRAAAWLLEQGAVLDTIRRFLSHPLTEEQQQLFDILMGNTENFTVQGYTVTLCTARMEKHINGISGVAAYLLEMLDAVALFVVVEMPTLVQLVCRSTDDAIDAGAVASLLGGGGHKRAAAAAIHERTLAEICTTIKTHLFEQVQPAVQVADLMSFQARTVNADEIVKDLIPVLRRIGHEGYPVLDNGKVIGLLTLRDADRAIEHGLSQAKVRDVMQGGAHTLTPSAAIPELEQLMVNSGWGQIPVVSDSGSLVGIVTRTDLLKHWSHTHPTVTPRLPKITLAEMAAYLGHDTTRLIQLITDQAQQQTLVMYMVGGVVRDLLLERGNQDIDFVVESDAIDFAGALCEKYGGRVVSHKPFGTAKWHLAGINLPDIRRDALPDHLDFVTARNEFYAHPTALPTVYSASIRLDMARRDFTINTLAVQLSPAGTVGRILDIFGGMADLQQQLIRVLHSLSFVDDPTRIMRAVRFAERLQFKIEARTAELIHSALPMLHRITGERLRNELTLILQEAQPENILLKLEANQALPAIHPSLHFSPPLDEQFRRIRQQLPLRAAAEKTPDYDAAEDLIEMYWFIWMVQNRDIPDICERLLFGASKTQVFMDGAYILAERAMLTDVLLRPSQVVDWLERLADEALEKIIWLLNEAEQKQLAYYLDRSRTLRPFTDGNTLKEMGLSPGRYYKVILEALRHAWLDGEVQNKQDEMALLHKLIREHT